MQIYTYPPTLVQRSSVLDSLFIKLSIQCKTLDTHLVSTYQQKQHINITLFTY